MEPQALSPPDAKKLRLFGALVAAVLCTEWAITRSPLFHHGGAVAIGILLDLAVGVPLLFFLIVLRPARRSLLDASPVLALGVVVAGALLASRSDVRIPLAVAGACSEILVFTLLARRLRRAALQLRAGESDDLLLRVGSLTDPVLRVAGAEILVFYYALVGPWMRRPPRDDEFPSTETSGLGGLLLGLACVVGVETVVAHLLVRDMSPLTVWVSAASHIYALIWLAAAFQAARLRPTALGEDHLLVRTSLLWTAEVPRAAIARVESILDAAPDKRTLRAALGTPPVLLLTLKQPVVARGLLGIRRPVDRIALHVDEPARLRSALGGGRKTE